MQDKELQKTVEKALRAYKRTGARELPSVVKSVPRVFKDAVDTLVATLEAAVEEDS